MSQQRAPCLPETEKGDTRKKPEGITDEEIRDDCNGVLEQIKCIKRLAQSAFCGRCLARHRLCYVEDTGRAERSWQPWELVTVEEAIERFAAANYRPVTEIGEEKFTDILEVLPPLDWQGTPECQTFSAA